MTPLHDGLFQVPPGPYFAECWTATTGAPVTGGPGTHNAFGVSPYGYATADQLPPPPPYCVLTYWSGPCERSTDAPSARATGSVVATYSAAAQPPTGVFQVIHHSAQLVCDDSELVICVLQTGLQCFTLRPQVIQINSLCQLISI